MKRFLCLLLLLAMVLSLAACGECDHDWEKATCEDPKTCSKCGEEKGEPEDEHDWEEDDGEMVCSWCGEECDHEFEDGECEICGMVEEDSGSADDQMSGDGDDHQDDEDPDVSHSGSSEIVGQWLVEIAMGEELTGLEGFYVDELPLLFTFSEDGVMTMSFYEPYLADAVERIENEMYNYLEAVIIETFGEEGYSLEDIDALFQAQYDMTLSEYIINGIKEQNMYQQLLDMEETCDYSFDGKVLILDGIEMTVEIHGDELMITSCVNPDFWAEVGKDLPVILRRID